MVAAERILNMFKKNKAAEYNKTADKRRVTPKISPPLPAPSDVPQGKVLSGISLEGLKDFFRLLKNPKNFFKGPSL